MPYFGEHPDGKNIVCGFTINDLQVLAELGQYDFMLPGSGITVHIVFRPTADELQKIFVDDDGTPARIHTVLKGPDGSVQ